MTALSYLRSIEWTHPQAEGSCPKCGWSKLEVSKFGGHPKTCSLAAAIADAEELEKRRGLRTREEIEAALTTRGSADTHAGPRSALRWVIGEK